MGPRWFAALAVAVLALGVPSVAAACDCGAPATWDYTVPADGATGVPTNTRVFVPPSMLPWERGATPSFYWKDAAGTPVPFDVASLCDFVVLVPRAELAPETSYTAGVVGEEYLLFTTGAGPDTVPPPVPQITDVGRGEVSTGTSCGNMAYVPVVVRSEAAELILLDLGAAAGFDPATMTGAVDAIEPGGEAVYFYIGEPACAAPTAEPGETTRVRFAALDGAGNLSAWTDPRRIEVPDYGCGCRSAGADGVGLLALGLVGLALRRRR